MRRLLLVTLLVLAPALAADEGSAVTLTTESKENAPTVEAVWFPGGDSWDLLRVRLSTESASPFRGVLRVDFDLSDSWHRSQRNDFRIERAVYVSQETSQPFDILLPAQAVFLEAVIVADGQPDGAEPAVEIDPPSGGNSRRGRREISEPKSSWIAIGDSSVDATDMVFSSEGGTMRSLPTSIHYLANCDAIVVLEQRELPAETIALLANAVKAGATLITGAPTLADSCPALLAKLFGEGYDAKIFFEDQQIYENDGNNHQYPSMLRMSGPRGIVLERTLLSFLTGEPELVRLGRLSHITYLAGSGRVIVVDGPNELLGDMSDWLYVIKQSPLFPKESSPSTEKLAPAVDLAQEYVFGPMAIVLLLLMYVIIAGPVLFFVLRKRAPALLVPVGMAFCLVAVVLIFIGINVRRALAPDALSFDITVFGADGRPTLVHSLLSTGDVQLRRPISHALAPLEDSTRLRPLTISLSPAEQMVKDAGLGEWQALNVAIDAPPAKDQQPLSLVIDKDGSFVSSVDLKYALVMGGLASVSTNVFLLTDVEANKPIVARPLSAEELEAGINDMDSSFKDTLRSMVQRGVTTLPNIIIAIPADPDFLKPPYDDSFEIRRTAVAWLPLVSEAPAREKP